MASKMNISVCGMANRSCIRLVAAWQGEAAGRAAGAHRAGMLPAAPAGLAQSAPPVCAPGRRLASQVHPLLPVRPIAM